MSRQKHAKFIEKQLILRDRLWPQISDADLWVRTQRDGFITIPRTMPLIMSIMDDLSKGRPVSSTYLELFCRSFDECFVILHKPQEMAFHAGFTGQRAERTWKDRLQILADLNFINIKSGPSGPMSYALIYNPYLVIKKHSDNNTPGLRDDKYNALIARAIEIGAKDLDPPIEDAAVDIDDEIPF